VAVVNPRQVRDFVKATGELAETDSLDAQAVRPEVRPAPDEQARELAAILARRRQVAGMLVAEGNRLETTVSPVRNRIEAHIEFLESVDQWRRRGCSSYLRGTTSLAPGASARRASGGRPARRGTAESRRATRDHGPGTPAATRRYPLVPLTLRRMMHYTGV
jgi:hypothetical protein